MDREYIDKPFMEMDPTHKAFFGPHLYSMKEAEAWREKAQARNQTVIGNPTPNSRQVGGSHYQGKGIQPWDYVIANNMGYMEGCIIKYVSRYKDKNGLEDLKKARHYLDKLMEGIGGA